MMLHILYCRSCSSRTANCSLIALSKAYYKLIQPNPCKQNTMENLDPAVNNAIGNSDRSNDV